jgi:hypothetical protein
MLEDQSCIFKSEYEYNTGGNPSIIPTKHSFGIDWLET